MNFAKKVFIGISLIFALLVVPFLTDAKATATSRPNALSVELLGRAGLYSFNYDRSLTDSVGVGFGLSFFSATAGGATASVFIIPVYVNYYFSPGPHRMFVTGGVDIIAGKVEFGGSSASATGAAVVVGGGYEYRGSGGFLFRAAPYILFGGGTNIWGGLSFGYAF